VVFFFGVFNKRLNSKGCLSALLVGFALGIFRLAVDTPVALKMTGFENGYAPGSFLWIVNNTYFQYYSLLIFVVSAVVMVAVSYLSEAPEMDKLKGIVYANVSDEEWRHTRSSWDWRDVVTSCMVVGLIIAVYVYFSG
jgi:solute:Na+ symporter, SSS family